MSRRIFTAFTVLLLMASGAQVSTQRAVATDVQQLTQALTTTLGKFHQSYDVYRGPNWPGNHFHARGKMGNVDRDPKTPVAQQRLPAMREAATCADGLPCIEARFRSQPLLWGGWYWMPGVLGGTETTPRETWGGEPNVGIDLRGATHITFKAAGAAGGEHVEFFALGVGWNPDLRLREARYPDSSAKVSLGTVMLDKSFREFTIDLRGQDLSYTLGGFGWVAGGAMNRDRDITFFLRDISYHKGSPDAPRLPVSFSAPPSLDRLNQVLGSVAFTYDAAMALTALAAAGDLKSAGLIAEALLYAQQNDRHFTDGRVRNAYAAGDLTLPPGWTPGGRRGVVRLPGWYDPTSRLFYEDSFQVSTHTGNVAFAALGLMNYIDRAAAVLTPAKRASFVTAVTQMASWIEANCRDDRGAGGYRAGFEGWDGRQAALRYKATEHNIDLVAMFERVGALTGDIRWRASARHARRFVMAMWDEADGKFWTGTTLDGVTPNQSVIPLDVQAWAVLALGEPGRLARGLSYAERHLRVEEGFDFNQDRDGIWYEGSAQVALAYRAIGRTETADAIVRRLRRARLPSGEMPAASKDRLTTGFESAPGQQWHYYNTPATASTAWALLAELGVNPFAAQKKP